MTEKKLLVGFGRKKAMPETVMPLGGVGLVGREYTGVHDELYITCVAITDAVGETVLMYTQDFLKTEVYMIPIRKAISEATGIDEANIMIASTHTHAAPAIYYDKVNGVETYRRICQNAAIEAAREALADRTETQITVGTVQAKGLAFCRHYIMPDGTVKKNPGKNATPVAHADDPDDTMQLVCFTRSQKKDILLVGFNIHPCFYGQYKQTLISADAPASVRNYIEAKTDCLVAYFTGAAGNQTATSQLSNAEDIDCDTFGARLGQLAVDALPHLKPVAITPIKLKTVTFTGKCNKERVDLYDQACEITEIHSTQGPPAHEPLLKKYGIASAWEAYAIVKRYQSAETETIPLSAMSLGGLSFIFAPYEMFGPHGMYIKENTPNDMTFVVTCANGCYYYMPTRKAYTYDVYEKLVARFAPGTAEDLVDTFLQMLTDLKNN